MAVDTPAVIAVIGAGPIGLEAALYARFLGYDVWVYERSRVAERLLNASPDLPPTSWAASTSPLGVAALAAQDPAWQPPAADRLLTTTELAAEYFVRLANSDLLTDSVFPGAEVVRIERDDSPDGEPPAEDDLLGFRLHVRDAAGERVDTADVVLDASGAAAPSFGFPSYEADFYVLGAKRAGAESSAAGSDAPFLFVDGLAQIRELFKIIADRAGLDLYATIGSGL